MHSGTVHGHLKRAETVVSLTDATATPCHTILEARPNARPSLQYIVQRAVVAVAADLQTKDSSESQTSPSPGNLPGPAAAGVSCVPAQLAEVYS